MTCIAISKESDEIYVCNLDDGIKDTLKEMYITVSCKKKGNNVNSHVPVIRVFAKTTL